MNTWSEINSIILSVTNSHCMKQVWQGIRAQMRTMQPGEIESACQRMTLSVQIGSKRVQLIFTQEYVSEIYVKTALLGQHTIVHHKCWNISTLQGKLPRVRSVRVPIPLRGDATAAWSQIFRCMPARQNCKEEALRYLHFGVLEIYFGNPDFGAN